MCNAVHAGQHIVYISVPHRFSHSQRPEIFALLAQIVNNLPLTENDDKLNKILYNLLSDFYNVIYVFGLYPEYKAKTNVNDGIREIEIDPIEKSL